MRWEPEPILRNKDVFIIGGGTSLRGFDWNRLIGLPTIGCNTAFTLGESICNMCVFGDLKWFEKFKTELKTFKGSLLTNNPNLHTRNLDWIYTAKRKQQGLSVDPKELGWNSSTGALAINVALLLGAKNVLLLGYDMQLNKDREPNWHTRVIDVPSDEPYRNRFKVGFKNVQKDLSLFPGSKVINLNPDSALTGFPIMTFDEYMEGTNNGMDISEHSSTTDDRRRSICIA